MGRTEEVAQWVLSALEASTSLVWCWEIASDELVWYGAAEQILGIPLEDLHLTGRRFTELIHPKDRSRVAAALGHATETRTPYEIEYRIVRPDGDVRWLREWAVVEHDDGGERARVLGLAHDISAQKSSQEVLRRDEAWFRALTRHSQDIITVLSREGRIRYSSPSGAEILGYEYGQMAQRTIVELVHPDDQTIAAGLLSTLIGEGGQQRAEFRVRAADGSWQMHEVLGTNLLDDPVIRGIVLNSRDVTERLRTERALRESEERFRLLTESASDVLHMQGADGVITYISPSVRSVLGYPAEALIGRPALELVHRDDRAKAVEVLRTCMTGTRSETSGSLRIHHRNGDWKTIETVAKRTSEPGATDRFAFYSRDVTEARRTDAILQRQALLFHTMSEAVVMTDPDHSIREWNPAAERVFGYTRDEVLGGDLEVVVSPGQSALRREITESLRTSGEWRGEIRMARRSGGDVLCETVITRLLDEDGVVIGDLSVHRDITDRKRAEAAIRRSEELFRSLIEHSPDIITVVAPDGEVLFGSNSVERVLGYDVAGIRGRNIFDFVHPSDVGAMAESFEHRAETPGVGTPRQLRLRHADGSWRWVEARADNLLDQPAIRGLMITARDVTGQIEIEDRIRQMQKLESIGRLAGGVAHDFNNILTGIVGHTQLLLSEKEEGTEEHGDLKAILHASERATGLTRQLLAFSRKQVLRTRVIDLNEVALSAEGMLRRLIESNVSFVAEPGSQLWRVRADPGQMEQVLLNLVVNARDALPDGGEIVVRTRNAVAPGSPELESHLPPGEYVLLTVSDTGIGMDEETLTNAFEPFFTTKPVGKGTGLGLATVYGIVRQMGGYVWADSAVGEGTTVSVCLPREVAEVDRPAPEPEAQAEGGAETILVAEDEASVRSLVTRTLRSAGYTVLEARDGAEALEVSRTHDGMIDLLLTDVMMPGLTGTKLVATVRAERSDMRILFMTGYSESILRENGASATDEELPLLQKPFPPTDLMQKVREVLDAG